MAKEFEAKVLLTADEFIQFMTKNHPLLYSSSKEDEYWSKYSSTEEAIKNEESLTRLRKSEGNCWYLTLKNKKNQNGFEDNVELETKFSDKKALEKLLTEAGYHPYFSKYKCSWLMHDKIALPDSIKTNIELEIVENSKNKEDPNYKCFYAIEVECVIDDPDFSEDYLSVLIKSIFKNYGKTEEDFETRSWFELLS